jgi:tol-pal system protein YbgF
VKRELGGGALIVVILAVTLGWSGTGCATTTGTTQIQADLDTLRQQVWKLQKENAALAQQVAQAAPSASSPPPEQPAAELRARLETVARDVQVLQTRAEESEQRLNDLTGELRAARAALDTMGRAQPALPVLSVPGAAAPAMGTAVPAGNGQEPPPGPPPSMAPVSGSGADLFRAGYSDYGRGKFDQALAELEEFLRLHPQDDLADDAQYLIGEVYFSQQKYPEALGAYDRLLKEHPGGERAASAHLKKGLALLEMNRTADAVIQFQHVVSAYPKSEEARVARERLRALGLRER